MNELKILLARISVLTTLAYVVSGILFHFFPDLDYAWLAVGGLVMFNLVYTTIKLKKWNPQQSMLELPKGFKIKFIIQYALNVMIFILFMFRV